MTMQRMGAVAICLAIVTAWAFMLFNPSRRPDLMRPLAGCYRGGGSISGIEIVISPDGVLSAQGQALKVAIAQDKIGLSFLPERRIIYDPALASKLVIDSSSPLLVRISDDRRSIIIPGGTHDIVLNKTECPNKQSPAA